MVPSSPYKKIHGPYTVPNGPYKNTLAEKSFGVYLRLRSNSSRLV